MTEARKRILCIEDDYETAGLIADELVDRGYEVKTVHNGSEALRAIFARQPHLILSDILMPSMSGFELLRRLATIRPKFENMPFIIMTAFADHDSHIKGRQLGADDYLIKPIDFDTLEAVIRRWLQFAEGKDAVRNTSARQLPSHFLMNRAAIRSTYRTGS